MRKPPLYAEKNFVFLSGTKGLVTHAPGLETIWLLLLIISVSIK